jgi:phosphotransferase system HPr (HPr) family protein
MMGGASTETVCDSFRVVNIAGIHLRPAQMIARLCSSYTDCEALAIRDDVRVNPKSIMGLTELIGACGCVIGFEVRGEKAADLIGELRELFAKGFGEEIDERFAADAGMDNSAAASS